MESCNNAERDIDKILTKFSAFKRQYESNLNQLEDQLDRLRSELQQLPADEPIAKHLTVLKQYHKEINTTGQKLSTNHKELHGNVSRIGKTIDKNFDPDCSTVFPSPLCADAEHESMLNLAICEHYFRQGRTEVAEEICKEAHLEIPDGWKQPFMDINYVLQCLKERNLDPALTWVENNQDQLRERKSCLEFLLHRLKFIEIMKKGPQAQDEALQYSRKFQLYAHEHSKDIQLLMGSFLYMRKGLQNSPYSSLLDEKNWDDICCVFTKESCSILGLPIDSPIFTSFSVGCKALPALVAIKSVVEKRQCSGVLSEKEELPVDIELPLSQRYHSIFACPILRQQTTANNPPMRLTCGHAISYDAVKKLITGSKLKCPYCPMVQAPCDAKRLTF